MVNKRAKYIKALLEFQQEHQETMRQIIDDAMNEQENLYEKLNEEEALEPDSFGDKIADKVASFGGSWAFIISFFLFIAIWMVYNTLNLGTDRFDPYPFILLNLVLSCLAAIQAPVILMSQNRQEDRDRRRARNDYLINLKAELKNRAIDKKLDLLINRLFNELLEIQAEQIHKLGQIQNSVSKFAVQNSKTKEVVINNSSLKSKDTSDKNRPNN